MENRYTVATELASRTTGTPGAATDALRDRLVTDGGGLLDLAVTDMDAATARLVAAQLVYLRATVDVIAAPDVRAVS